MLNPALIKASKQAIDYVIYHEFCHAYYPNHTEEFYNRLSLKMPNWEKLKEKMELKLLSY
ncbi:MAG: M48 family metallopeptidase [Alphaproteobacteria bacterium]